MIERAYIMLHTINGKSKEVFQSLQGKLGVVLIDTLDGPPDVVLIIEAQTKEKLAEVTVSALTEVEMVTGNFDLLTVHKPRLYLRPRRRSPGK